LSYRGLSQSMLAVSLVSIVVSVGVFVGPRRRAQSRGGIWCGARVDAVDRLAGTVVVVVEDGGGRWHAGCGSVDLIRGYLFQLRWWAWLWWWAWLRRIVTRGAGVPVATLLEGRMEGA
jgi:hypothetical protein